MDQIQIWAIKKAGEAIGYRHDDFPVRYWLDARDAAARALVAERERAAKIASDIFPDGKRKSQNAAYCAGNIIAAAIRKGE